VDVLRQKLSLLPDKPGVYLMKDETGEVIYVGKAKVLKNRVRSYFTGSHDGKTQILVSQIADFEYIITKSEVEALVLECNLIKKFSPKYNIMLRDDKSYPYLTITDEEHPRLLVTRQVKKGSGKYFGPYPNAGAAKEAARLLNRLFPLRKCHQMPRHLCLYYHLDQCLGPCVHPIPPQAYEKICKEITTFLKGGQGKIIDFLQQKMEEAAASLRFEQAKEYRDLIADLKRLGEKQNITLTDFIDRDVLGYATTTDQMCVQVFYLRQGQLLARDSFVFPYYEQPEEAFISFVAQLYTEKNLLPKEILLPPVDITVLSHIFPVTIPQRGQKRELVQLAAANAQTVLHEEVMLEGKQAADISQALTDLGKALGIPAPTLIEAFDISNLAGTNTVAGMIQFLDGKPYRSGYRKFKIHHMPNMDDTASMRQVINRRYARVLGENLRLPDLILVDGGKGQIRAALEALTELGLNLPVAGLVKNEKHQTAGLLTQDGHPVSLDRHSPLFHLLERMQEEVHRFAITFHRQQRAKQMTNSQLERIPGVGSRRRQILLRAFKSLDKLRSASLEELIGAGLPRSTAEDVFRHFHPEERHPPQIDRENSRLE